MPFPTADKLTVNTNQNVTALMRPVRPLQYVVYLPNFMIVPWIIMLAYWISLGQPVAYCMFRVFPVLLFPSSWAREKERQNNKVCWGWSKRESHRKAEILLFALQPYQSTRHSTEVIMFLLLRATDRLADSEDFELDRFKRKIFMIRFWTTF